MKQLRIVTIAAAALLLSAPALLAGHAPRGAAPHIHVAQMGMGGLTTTINSNAHTVVYNPGMLATQELSIELTFPLGVDNDGVDFINFIDENQEEFQSFDELSESEQEEFLRDAEQFDGKWYGIELSPFLGAAGKGWGFAAYQATHSNLGLDLGVLAPKVKLRAYADQVVMVGGARSLELGPLTVGVGAAGRYFQRRHIDPRIINATEASAYQDIVSEVLDELEESRSGFGLDVGGVTSLEMPVVEQLTVGAAIQDLYGQFDGEWLPPYAKLGAMTTVPGVVDGRGITGWDVGIELVDALNREGTSFWQKVNMGTELRVLANILAFRGGFHQGYPTFGAGLSFGVLRLDIARFTRELGTAPGMNGDDVILAQLRLGW